MNRCFPTAFHWTLLSSGMNARWRQESFVSATVSCPSFKQTGTSKPLQVYLGASAGAQLLSSYLQGCSFSSCPEQLWNQHFKDSSEGGESSVHLQFALQHPQRCGTRWHPCVNPVLARQRQRQRALCGSLAHTHARLHWQCLNPTVHSSPTWVHPVSREEKDELCWTLCSG